jgi:homoserine kinase
MALLAIASVCSGAAIAKESNVEMCIAQKVEIPENLEILYMEPSGSLYDTTGRRVSPEDISKTEAASNPYRFSVFIVNQKKTPVIEILRLRRRLEEVTKGRKVVVYVMTGE